VSPVGSDKGAAQSFVGWGAAGARPPRVGGCLPEAVVGGEGAHDCWRGLPAFDRVEARPSPAWHVTHDLRLRAPYLRICSSQCAGAQVGRETVSASSAAIFKAEPSDGRENALLGGSSITPHFATCAEYVSGEIRWPQQREKTPGPSENSRRI